MDKNYVLARLQAGETLQTIGDDFAAVMNAALDEFNEAKRKEAEEAAIAAAQKAAIEDTKREIAHKFVENLRDYAELSGVDPELLGMMEGEDIGELVAGLDELMSLLTSLQSLKDKFAPTAAPAQLKRSPIVSMGAKPSDDEILKSFILGL